MRLFDGLELPASADFHVHLRDGDMMAAVTPMIRKGGVDVVYVMPNLDPPIITVEAALSYRSRLEALAPNVTFLMSLYLHPSISPATIKTAKAAGITGVKLYPAGVTTNSGSGVVDYATFYPVFAAMEAEGMILNLHGEVPPRVEVDAEADDTTVLNAEERFLPNLLDLHRRFPALRIVLEHCSTAEAIKAVEACGPTVAATITPHHMFLTVDDVVGDPINFCKPVAKLPSDRLALIRAAVADGSKVFLGTDSAPHSLHAKKGGGAADALGKCAAGVFTQPYATQFVLEAIGWAVERGYLSEEDVNKAVLRRFLSENGRKFYGLGPSKEKIRIAEKGERVVGKLDIGADRAALVPFRRQKRIYSLTWL